MGRTFPEIDVIFLVYNTSAMRSHARDMPCLLLLCTGLFGYSDVFWSFCIRGPGGPGPGKTRPEPNYAARLVANNVLANPVWLGAKFPWHAVWLAACRTQMQSTILGYLRQASYCYHFIDWRVYQHDNTMQTRIHDSHGDNSHT